MEQPFFFSHRWSGCVEIGDGETVLVGGVPGQDTNTFVYILVTGRILDDAGARKPGAARDP